MSRRRIQPPKPDFGKVKDLSNTPLHRANQPRSGRADSRKNRSDEYRGARIRQGRKGVPVFVGACLQAISACERSTSPASRLLPNTSLRSRAGLHFNLGATPATANGSLGGAGLSPHPDYRFGFVFAGFFLGAGFLAGAAFFAETAFFAGAALRGFRGLASFGAASSFGTDTSTASFQRFSSP